MGIFLDGRPRTNEEVRARTTARGREERGREERRRFAACAACARLPPLSVQRSFFWFGKKKKSKKVFLLLPLAFAFEAASSRFVETLRRKKKEEKNRKPLARTRFLFRDCRQGVGRKRRVEEAVVLPQESKRHFKTPLVSL